jgi:hypothetical protein
VTVPARLPILYLFVALYKTVILGSFTQSLTCLQAPYHMIIVLVQQSKLQGLLIYLLRAAMRLTTSLRCAQNVGIIICILDPAQERRQNKMAAVSEFGLGVSLTRLLGLSSTGSGYQDPESVDRSITNHEHVICALYLGIWQRVDVAGCAGCHSNIGALSDSQPGVLGRTRLRRMCDRGTASAT